VYERLRQKEPDISIWISVSQVYRGADRVIAPRSEIIGPVLRRRRGDIADGKASDVVDRDENVLDVVESTRRRRPTTRFPTCEVYASGHRPPTSMPRRKGTRGAAPVHDRKVAREVREASKAAAEARRAANGT